MLKILELIIQLHETTKMLEELLQKELKKNNMSISCQEVICIAQSFENPNDDIKALAEKSVYTYQHLLFNLNKLERKNFLNLRVGTKSQNDLLVNFTNKGQEVMELLNKKQTKLVLKNTPINLDTLREELQLKLK